MGECHAALASPPVSSRVYRHRREEQRAQRPPPHLISQRQVALAPLQQQPGHVRVATLGSEHQGRASLVILDVGVRSVAQQQADHHHAAVPHRQVQGSLASLETNKQTNTQSLTKCRIFLRRRDILPTEARCKTAGSLHNLTFCMLRVNT